MDFVTCVTRLLNYVAQNLVTGIEIRDRDANGNRWCEMVLAEDKGKVLVIIVEEREA
jgi:hypothetical protein